jgi:hypothetical protein
MAAHYGDFSSVVQLGVSLHVGTALLQFYGDLGVQPLVRIIERIKGLFRDPGTRPSEAVKADLDQLEGDFEIFKVRLFHEYRKYVWLNTVVAAALIAGLVFLAFNAQSPADPNWAIFFVALSLVPAPATLFALWVDASRMLKPMIDQADALEDRALHSQ